MNLIGNVTSVKYDIMLLICMYMGEDDLTCTLELLVDFTAINLILVVGAQKQCK